MSDVKQLIDEFLTKNKEEYNNLTYFEKEKIKLRHKEVRKQSRLNFEKIKVSKEVGEYASMLRSRINLSNDMNNYNKDKYLEKEDKAFPKFKSEMQSLSSKIISK